jgi:hypothetical protein
MRVQIWTLILPLPCWLPPFQLSATPLLSELVLNPDKLLTFVDIEKYREE